MELLGRFNDQMTRIVDDAFGTQWAEIEEILAIIALVHDHVVSTRRIAQVSGMNRRAISRMLARLRAEGLIMTRPSDKDGRVVDVVLTDRGELQSEKFRASIADFFRLSRDLAHEISGGITTAEPLRAGAPSSDPIDLLRRVCEAGASLVGYMPDAATQGQLAARQRAALVQITIQAGVRPSDLSSSLGVSPAGAAYIVDQLCAKGFITRQRGVVPEDRRAVVLEATADGERAVLAVMDGIERQRDTLANLFAEVAHWHAPVSEAATPRLSANANG